MALKPRAKAFLWAALPVVLLLPAQFWGARQMNDRLQANDRAEVQRVLDTQALSIERAVGRVVERLDGLALFVGDEIQSKGSIDATRFNTFAAGLRASSPWIRNFQIVQAGVVVQVFPLAGNEAILGYDLKKAPPQFRGEDVTRALGRSSATVTGPLRLVQGGLGLVIRERVAAADGVPRLVGVALDLTPLLLDSGLGAPATGGIQIAVASEGGEAFFGTETVFAQGPMLQRVVLPDGAWQIAGIPEAGWRPSLSAPLLLFHLAWSTIVLLLGALFFVLARSREHLAGEVRERTRELETSERKYREVVELAASIILRWDVQGRITFLNDFGLHFFGYEATEIVGRLVIDTIALPTPAGSSDMRLFLESIRADPASFELNTSENLRRNGERAWVAWSNRILRNEEGEIVAFLSVGTDVTERHRAREQIFRLNEDLKRQTELLELRVAERTEALAEAMEEARSADRLKSAFLATMSHELRTPLNSIIGFTGLVLQELPGPINGEQRKQLGMVRESANHLLAIVSDVLDISRIEAGNFEMVRQPFSAASAIERVVGLVRSAALAKHLPIVVEHPAAGDLAIDTLMGDAPRLEQVLYNLLSNAIKFTERGSINIKVNGADRCVQDSGGEVVPVLCISVCDTGIGIRSEDLPLLFRPFRQVDSSLARKFEGTGLGLALCQRLVRLMGGMIEVVSAPGEGSVFTVTLPREGSTAKEAA